jgi:hypothetical protein
MCRDRDRARAPRGRTLLRALALFAALSGCGAGPRGRVAEAAQRGDFVAASGHYATLRASDGDDADLLAFVAEALLVSEARSGAPSRRSAAVQQLALAGTRGREPLERLAADMGPVGTEALVALARAGQRDARRVLRGLADSTAPEVRAAAVLGMEVEGDRTLVVAWCADPAREVREAACGRLGELAPDTDILRVLVERARIDPDAQVRSAAVRALGRFGGLAVLALRDRLSDAEPRVRAAALESLLRADREEGRGAAASLLETPTSQSTLEAARLLATTLDPGIPPSTADRASARAHLLGALTNPDAALRNQAAIALVAVAPDDETTAVLRARVETEPDVGVRLSLARALLPSATEAARAALHRLLVEDHGMTGAQAAALLAGAGDDEGLARLRTDRTNGDALVRRVVVRALARDALRPVEVGDALNDDDALVRIQAAGGILAAAAVRTE